MSADLQDAVVLAEELNQQDAAPKCKRCGEPCEFYSPHAGYSVKCRACNQQACIQRRNSWALHAAATNKRRRARAKQKRASR